MSDRERQEIIRLWKSKSFSASHAGVNTMKIALKLEKNINIPKKKLREILLSIPSFADHVRIRRRFPRRPYTLFGVNELHQADIISFYEYKNWKYSLVLVECFSKVIKKLLNIFVTSHHLRLSELVRLKSVSLENLCHTVKNQDMC